MAATSVLSLNAKLYRNTGTYATPTWNEVPNVRDLTVSLDKAEADTSTRLGKFKTVRGSLRNVSIDWGMVQDPADADWIALRDAFLNDTQVDLAVADGPIATTGTQYFRAVCEIMKFQMNQALTDVLMTDVSAKPTYNDNAPTYVTVA